MWLFNWLYEQIYPELEIVRYAPITLGLIFLSAFATALIAMQFWTRRHVNNSTSLKDVAEARLAYSEQIQGDLRRQIEALKTVITEHLPDRDPDVIATAATSPETRQLLDRVVQPDGVIVPFDPAAEPAPGEIKAAAFDPTTRAAMKVLLENRAVQVSRGIAGGYFVSGTNTGVAASNMPQLATVG